MPGTIETVTDSFKDAFNFFAANTKPLLASFAKIVALAYVVQIASTALSVGAGMAVPEGAGLAESLPLLAVALVGFIALSILSMAISATAYSVVEARGKGKGISILARARELIVPIGKYTLAYLGIVLGLLVATFVSMTVGGAFVGVLAAIALLAVGVGALFALQFTVAEIAVRGTDVIEAFKRSFSIVRGNLMAVALFDVVLLAVLIALTLAFSLAQQAPLMAVGAGADMPVMAAAVAAWVALSFLDTLIVSLLSTICIYFFWKRVSA